jgi:hypothetical protein
MSSIPEGNTSADCCDFQIPILPKGEAAGLCNPSEAQQNDLLLYPQSRCSAVSYEKLLET